MPSKSKDSSLATAVVLVCLVVAVGIGAYIKLAPADTVPRETTIEEEPSGGGVQLLTPYYADGDLKFSTEPAEVPADVDPMVFAVNSYLRTTTFVPKEAVLKSCTVEDTVATLDFNAAFETSYSTFDESTVVNGVLATMGQFKDVSYVRFTVEGRPLQTLGNLDLTDPQQVVRIPAVEKSGGVPKTAKS